MVNGTLKVTLVSAQKKRRASEKASIFLENTDVVLNRMLMEIWTVKAILMKSRMEMRNMFLKTGGKTIVVLKRCKERG